MIIFLPNFIYSDDIFALMRKHYGRPIVCHLRWGRRGDCDVPALPAGAYGSRRVWHLDAASRLIDLASPCGISRSGSRRLAAGVSGLLYYVHIYFIRSPVFPLFWALIVCISVNAAFYTLLSKFYVFNVHLALLLSLVTFASTFYLYIIFSSFVPL